MTAVQKEYIGWRNHTVVIDPDESRLAIYPNTVPEHLKEYGKIISGVSRIRNADILLLNGKTVGFQFHSLTHEMLERVKQLFQTERPHG